MENICPDQFLNILNHMEEHNQYISIITHANQLYNIHAYRLQQLTPHQIAHIYWQIRLKNKHKSQQQWCESELRIFIWLLLGYISLQSIQLAQMTQQRWLYFTPIFPNKNHLIFQFEAKSISKHQHRLRKWQSQEIQLFNNILSCDNKNKWNIAARKLFTLSNGKYFRTGKQCRERWNNHLDPIKVKAPWTKDEDIILFDTILQIGKKWSTIAKQLAHTRTQHMVKNRFKSIYSIYAKKLINQSEDQIIHRIQYDLINHQHINYNQDIPNKLDKMSTKTTIYLQQSLSSQQQLQQLEYKYGELELNGGFNFMKYFPQINELKVLASRQQPCQFQQE